MFRDVFVFYPGVACPVFYRCSGVRGVLVCLRKGCWVEGLLPSGRRVRLAPRGVSRG